LVLLSGAAGHLRSKPCNHDGLIHGEHRALANETETARGPLNYHAHPMEEYTMLQEGRRLGGSHLNYGTPRNTAFKPIRIKVFFQPKLIALSEDLKRFLQKDLLPAAMEYWGNALKVIPVEGNFRVPRFCTSSWNNGKCAAYQMMQKCGASSNPYAPSIPDEHLDYLEVCPNSPSGCSRVKGGVGVPECDYILYVSAFQTPHCGHTKETQTLAYAGKCARDQYDRPVVGAANFCPGKLENSSAAWDMQLSTAVHEIGHALGFSADNMAYFRYALACPTYRTVPAAADLAGTFSAPAFVAVPRAPPPLPSPASGMHRSGACSAI
jgi:hypothetical protein